MTEFPELGDREPTKRDLYRAIAKVDVRLEDLTQIKADVAVLMTFRTRVKAVSGTALAIVTGGPALLLAARQFIKSSTGI